MGSNYETPTSVKFTFNEETIHVPSPSLARAQQYSKVLRASECVRFDIPATESARDNFQVKTIETFFQIFEKDVGAWDDRDLDCETLVRLCHAFWWLECDTEAIRKSPAAQHLKKQGVAMNWFIIQQTMMTICSVGSQVQSVSRIRFANDTITNLTSGAKNSPGEYPAEDHRKSVRHTGGGL
jgi:hypothetical protein